MVDMSHLMQIKRVKKKNFTKMIRGKAIKK